jgi:hypothetical protein
MTGSRPVNVAAEYRNDPSGVLEGAAERRHGFGPIEVDGIRSYTNLERGVVREDGHRSCGFGIYHAHQAIDPFAAEVAAVAAWA